MTHLTRETAPPSLTLPDIRAEGRAKVTGVARYAADVAVPGMLHAAFLGSPYPHARILSVDTTAALAMPGVHAVLVGRDAQPARLGRRLQDWPVLAWELVRFIGDRVAVVAAEDQAQAEAATRAIDITYEELPAVFEPEDALKPDAPVLHPDRASYQKVGQLIRPLRGFHDAGATTPEAHPNLVGRLIHEHGDLAAGFAKAVRIFENEFDLQRVASGYIEPRASLVRVEGDRVHVVSTNRRPFSLRAQMGLSLGLKPENIAVAPIVIGGDFGGKALSLDEYALYLLARATGRPVRSLMSYADELRISGTRRATRIRLRTGVDAAGRITAHEARIVYNCGAYAVGGVNDAGIPPQSETLIGYRVPAARVEALGVYTNTLPGGAHRAPGRPQIVFAVESQMDIIARALELDPLDFRERNLAAAGELSVMGEWPGSDLPEVIRTLRSESGWGTPLVSGRGRGAIIGVHHLRVGDVDETTVKVTLRRDGSVEVLTGLPEHGTGSHTAMQRIVAGELGIPVELVDVRQGGTWEAADDPGHGGSRSTVIHGGAALDAARRLKAAVDERAPGVSFAQAARVAAPLSVTGTVKTEPHDYGAWGQAVEVSVDSDSGAVRLERALIVAEVGTVINPLALLGTLEGGFVFGLGQAITEEVIVEDGRVVTSNLGEYKLPTITDIPPIKVVLLTSKPGLGPYGAKSAGELANPGPGAVISNAIADAVGVRLTSLPLTSEKVLGAIRAKAESAREHRAR